LLVSPVILFVYTLMYNYRADASQTRNLNVELD
jgi:hypothetical protein